MIAGALVEKMLDICSGHIPQRDMDLLSKDTNNAVYTYEYGFIFRVPSEFNSPSLRAMGYSKYFVRIITEARDLQCTFVKFDCDGSEYCLPIHEDNVGVHIPKYREIIKSLLSKPELIPLLMGSHPDLDRMIESSLKEEKGDT